MTDNDNDAAMDDDGKIIRACLFVCSNKENREQK